MHFFLTFSKFNTKKLGFAQPLAIKVFSSTEISKSFKMPFTLWTFSS